MTDAAPRPRLVLVRHGATEWSESGRHTGRTDVPLTDGGRAGAAALRPWLTSLHFALVLTSPLRRARETAALAGFPDAEVCADAVEWDYGEYEGRTTTEIRSGRPGWTVWRDGAPGGETIAQVGARADAVIARARAAGGDVLAFSHGHFSRVVAARWTGLPPADGARFAFAPVAVGVLGWEREQPVIERWNLTADDG